MLIIAIDVAVASIAVASIAATATAVGSFPLHFIGMFVCKFVCSCVDWLIG